MKKFLKIASIALVFGLALVSFAACGDAVAARSELTDQTDKQETTTPPTTDDTITTTTPTTTPDTTEPTTCGPDCACQSPVLCEHTCEHTWEEWLAIPHDGQLVKIFRCTKNHDHLSYEITDLPDEPDEPEPEKPTFIFDEEHLKGTTWRDNNQDAELTFYDDKTYEIGTYSRGTWRIDGNIVYLRENKHPNFIGEFQLNFTTDDTGKYTLSHEQFFNTEYAFILVEEVVS